MIVCTRGGIHGDQDLHEIKKAEQHRAQVLAHQYVAVTATVP
jgi:hypothetical protein